MSLCEMQAISQQCTDPRTLCKKRVRAIASWCTCITLQGESCAQATLNKTVGSSFNTYPAFSCTQLNLEEPCHGSGLLVWCLDTMAHGLDGSFSSLS